MENWHVCKLVYYKSDEGLKIGSKVDTYPPVRAGFVHYHHHHHRLINAIYPLLLRYIHSHRNALDQNTEFTT